MNDKIEEIKEDRSESERHDFRTDGGKSSSIAVEAPSIVLPRGGGAVRGIDEKFEVNSVGGSASLSLPLPVSSARGAAPNLDLTYNSGSGAGIFGLGWSINLPSIRRKTDHRLPTYQDEFESDVYLFAGAEDLVFEFQREANGEFSMDGEGNVVPLETDSPDGLFRIRRYKPRIEGMFARIERWMGKTTGEIKWRVITRENLTTLFGWTSSSRIADPANENRVFEWLPELVFDDKGNCARYKYKVENSDGFDPFLPQHLNRMVNGMLTYTNRHPEKILYGNKTPYPQMGAPYPPDDDFLFVTVFDYGEYNPQPPYDVIKSWDFRSDAFSSYKAGFEVRTTRLCRRVLHFHAFSELPGGFALVKSLDMVYHTSAISGLTFLTGLVSRGYIKKQDGTYTMKSLPPLEFDYRKHEWSREIKTLPDGSLENAPIGLDDVSYLFVDLYNEGLPGILSEQDGGWYYKRNLGEGKFEAAKPAAPKPWAVGLGHLWRLTDLDADGGRQLASYGKESPGFFELSDDGEWRRFRAFANLPNVDLNDPGHRFLDLNGDGKPDILIAGDQLFVWYESAGRDGFYPARAEVKPFDEERGPHMVFADDSQSVFLADMSGDGLTDIVRIRNGEVCYWPNLGYGRFGSRVSMANAPVFDHTGSFNPSWIRLADIDGSGTTDIIYLGRNEFSCWVNQAGNSLAVEPFVLDGFPSVHGLANVSAVDLMGDGLTCIVWSSALPGDMPAPLKYIELMNGVKPYLMSYYRNNMGKEVFLDYTPSTRFYIGDEAAGRPWATKLHFPVYCLSRVETRESVSGVRFVGEYSYHHGYYDHEEREFRGFGLVERMDSEYYEHWVKGDSSNVVERELHQAPTLTRTWFHTGAFLRKDKILGVFAHEYWYEELNRRGFGVTSTEAALDDARIVAAFGQSSSVLENLTAQEIREAMRACKGMLLRSELFVKDAPLVNPSSDDIKKELTPFTVATHNCMIELIQPKGPNRCAVFAVKESEAITYHYERNAGDPRITHHLNIRVDEYCNILESVEAAYPRLTPNNTLPAFAFEAQGKPVIIHTRNRFTNDVCGVDAHRLRLLAETETHELKGVPHNGFYYTSGDFENILAVSLEAFYHETTKEPLAGTSQKRLIEHARTLFYKDDLSGPGALYVLESRGIPYESYQLACTPELISDIFGSRVNAALMAEGHYVHSEGDDRWWVRSGSARYIEGSETVAAARARFFSPIAFVDSFSAKTNIRYFSNYFLLIGETEDPLGNIVRVEEFNFRMLTPRKVRDANHNLTEVIMDELGFVKAMAELGKGGEGDDLSGINEFTDVAEAMEESDFLNTSGSRLLALKAQNLLKGAGIRFVYDYSAFINTGKPVMAASIERERHNAVQPDAPVQLAFEFTDGLGRAVMKKVQAEPGKARVVMVNSDDTYSVAEIDTSSLSPTQLRWIGGGRTVLNNKGATVKKYEPYFSVNHHYENLKELVETGVTPIWRYDALGRSIRVDYPDGTFTKTEYGSWSQYIYDAGDTVLDSTWYINRVNRLIDGELIAEGKNPGHEKLAADSAAHYGGTPSVAFMDILGRPVVTCDHNRSSNGGTDDFYYTLLALDAEGNLRAVTDPRGNIVIQYKYDMLGQSVYQDSMDAGRRRMFMDIQGNPVRMWDERDHEFRHFYDILRRPVQSEIAGGDNLSPLNHIYGRIFYGENEPNPEIKNLRGREVRRYDTGGLLTVPVYDFKGNPLSETRRLFRHYKTIPNWTDSNLEADLETEQFTSAREYDALDRLVRQTAPDGSVIEYAYNEGGVLNSQTATHPHSPMSWDYIKDIRYNERGRRTKIVYGNNVETYFYYDRETFRLKRMESRRGNGDPLQDWRYTYDAVGNITHVEDKAVPVVFFDNQKITGLSVYRYDALYRLIGTSGRENSAVLAYDNLDNWNDAPFMHVMNPGDPLAMRHFSQEYRYDETGNILQVKHQASGNNWTRDYEYSAGNNRLLRTRVGARVFNMSHHPRHGFITSMPHMEEMGWNFRDELVKVARQRRLDGGIPETVYYQYDGQGQRLRKVIENTADPGVTPVKKEERLTIRNFELYRKHWGAETGLRRVSLSLIDEGSGERFVVIETRNDVDDGTEKHLVRYQLHNHIGSTGLELDELARVISYEEYHPFGTTAYQAKNSVVKSAAKRFRFTGKERDEESGFEYHGSRYYAPWLGRWLSPDPLGPGDGLNLYAYVENNPVSHRDDDGLQKKPAPKKPAVKKPKKTAAPAAKKEKKKSVKKETKKDPKKELEEKIKDEAAKRQKQADEDEAVLLEIRKDDEIQGAVGDAAELTGIDEESLEMLIIVESRGQKKAKTGSYHGLMQMGKDAFDEVVKNEKALFDTLKVRDKKSKKDRAVTWDDVKTDPWANVMVGALYAKMNRDKLLERDKVVQAQITKAQSDYEASVKAGKPDTDKFIKEIFKEGRPISDTVLNLYLAHQQGYGGLKNLYNNPDAMIKKNQRGNIAGFDKTRFTREGSGNKITNQEFVQSWDERFNRLKEIFNRNPAVK